MEVADMHVVAAHSISDPERFFAAIDAPIPEGMKLLSALPSRDGSKMVCVWEADSADSVRKIVDDTVGDSSSNEFFEVDTEKASGLPG
jgi:hypothetical protein